MLRDNDTVTVVEEVVVNKGGKKTTCSAKKMGNPEMSLPDLDGTCNETCPAVLSLGGRKWSVHQQL